MHTQKIKDFELIFDSPEDFKMLQFLGRKIPIRRKGSLGIWVDDSCIKPYAQIHRFGKNIKIHHIFAGCPLSDYVVDHINGNSLDNRRNNLRVCSRPINGFNKKTTGPLPRWVHRQRSGRFSAIVRLGIGTFDTAEEAFIAAYEFAKKHHNNLIIPEGDHYEF